MASRTRVLHALPAIEMGGYLIAFPTGEPGLAFRIRLETEENLLFLNRS